LQKKKSIVRTPDSRIELRNLKRKIVYSLNNIPE